MEVLRSTGNVPGAKILPSTRQVEAGLRYSRNRTVGKQAPARTWSRSGLSAMSPGQILLTTAAQYRWKQASATAVQDRQKQAPARTRRTFRPLRNALGAKTSFPRRRRRGNPAPHFPRHVRRMSKSTARVRCSS
ncbi:hypothetical protein NQZ68_040544 [Dissostichus eleginoides]|nr:hypothetical protein NQZ68_040544 [Dissostichus eleginoides]